MQVATANGLQGPRRQSLLLFVVSTARWSSKRYQVVGSGVAAGCGWKSSSLRRFCRTKRGFGRITAGGVAVGGSIGSTWWWQRSLLRLASFQTASSQSPADRAARVVSYVVVFCHKRNRLHDTVTTLANANGGLSSVSYETEFILPQFHFRCMTATRQLNGVGYTEFVVPRLSFSSSHLSCVICRKVSRGISFIAVLIVRYARTVLIVYTCYANFQAPPLEINAINIVHRASGESFRVFVSRSCLRGKVEKF